MKKLSVIIPVYNMEKYLEVCLDSVVKQMDDMEVIIIDDGSTDSSWDIILKYVNAYPDKVSAYQEENSGQGVARNWGISLANGEYIGFVDADDYIEEGMYETMVSKADQLNCDYVECGYRFVEEKAGKIKELPLYGHVREFADDKDMFVDPLVSPWNKIYKADVIKNNDIKFTEGKIYEDTAFYLKAIPFIQKRGFVDFPYVVHYKRGNSTMTSKKSLKVGNFFDVLNDGIGYYKDKGTFEKYKDELEFFCSKMILCSSMRRISQVSERKLKKKYIEESFDFLDKNFKDYKSNKYMKSAGINGKYMKINTRTVAPFFCFLMKMHIM